MMMIDRLVQELDALDCNQTIARIKHTKRVLKPKMVLMTDKVVQDCCLSQHQQPQAQTTLIAVSVSIKD